MKRVGLLVLLLVVLGCPLGQAAEDSRWHLLYQDKESSTYLDTVRFTSSITEGQYPDVYKAECWFKHTHVKFKDIVHLEKVLVEINIKTMTSSVKLLQGTVWDRGRPVKQKEPKDWEETVPGSRGEDLCLTLLNYDLERNKIKRN